MEKSASAFRTISEVADYLETPAHVLRFWESRFPQIKPVKRAGGRRYYRPADVALLLGIKRLLHDEGMTIRGVQKILREQGVRHVSGMPEADTEALDTAFAPNVVPEKPEARIVSLSDWVATPEAFTEPVGVIPVQTDDETVEEDAFRSALDWAKSLPATDAPAIESANAILRLTEKVAGDSHFATELTTPDLDEADVDAPAEDVDYADETAEMAVAENPPPIDVAVTAPATQPRAADPSDPAAIAAPDDSAFAATLDADDDSAAVWVPTELRKLSATHVAAHADSLRALHARLTALHTRMAEAARSSRS